MVTFSSFQENMPSTLLTGLEGMFPLKICSKLNEKYNHLDLCVPPPSQSGKHKSLTSA